MESSVGQCVNGVLQLTSACAAPLTCQVLPLRNKAGTSVACDTEADKIARIAEFAGAGSSIESPAVDIGQAVGVSPTVGPVITKLDTGLANNVSPTDNISFEPVATEEAQVSDDDAIISKAEKKSDKCPNSTFENGLVAVEPASSAAAVVANSQGAEGQVGGSDIRRESLLRTKVAKRQAAPTSGTSC